MGAEEPKQARPSWALKDSPLHLQHRHCTQTGKPWGLSAGEMLGGGRLQVAPAARSCLAFGPQLLGLPGNHGFSPCSQPVRWPSSGRTQEASRGSLPPLLGPRRLVSTTARKRDWSLKPPSLPTWGSTGKIVAFWLQARPDHSDQ